MALRETLMAISWPLTHEVVTAVPWHRDKELTGKALAMQWDGHARAIKLS